MDNERDKHVAQQGKRITEAEWWGGLKDGLRGSDRGKER